MNNTKPIIGILGWEDRINDELPGSLARPDTFEFPTMFKHIEGACFDTIIKNPDRQVLDVMIQEAIRMEEAGIRAITTSCGFNSIFQDELAKSINIPVFTSTLLLVPLIHRMLSDNQTIGIITANKNHLTQDHLARSGIPEVIPVHIKGIEDTSSSKLICNTPNPELIDTEVFRKEIFETCSALMAENETIGAIVFEMTILHIFSDEIRKAFDIPVFDITNLIRFIYGSISARDIQQSAT